MLPGILPGILSGVAMAFARAVGEIGAIVLIAGNLPFKTEVASIHLFYRIEQDPEGSAAVAVVLLAISFTVLLGIGALALARHEARAWVGSRSGSLALGYLALLIVGPLAMMVWRTAEDLDGAWAAITAPNTVSAFKLTLLGPRSRLP